MNPTSWLFAFVLVGCAVACWALPGAGGNAKKEKADYAESKYVDSWLRHPVYGDPSFDSFERLPGNPIYRGSGEFAWPVNGFLFIDPKSPNWYVYVGDYKAGYGGGQARCVLLRSADRGKTWQNLGPVVEGDPAMFDKGGYTPDATVVYDGGRYHMVYDWNVPEVWGEGGLAYAWAEKPEGPWHRASEPITRNTTLAKLDGKYRRTYGGMLVRRKNDWLVLGLMDAAPNSWTLFAMTAKRPEGPYSERRIVRQVETDTFQPPLMECFPAFSHDGWVYAPATSVALNRDFVCIFRAPLEKADDPRAWEIYRHGSAWHSEDVENEFAGLWGQTFSGQVLPDGRLMAMFNSRDPKNLGTVNMASRPWTKPLRPRGFVLSGHAGPSFTCLNRSYGGFKLGAELSVSGTARVVWDYQGALGPDKPASDATLHPLATTRYAGLELSEAGWKVVDVGADGATRVLGEGTQEGREWRIAVRRDQVGATQVSVGGKAVWRGVTGPLETRSRPTITMRAGNGPSLPSTAGAAEGSATGLLAGGPIGLWVAPNSRAEVERFEIEGDSTPAHLNYLYTDGLLGAGERESDWEVAHGEAYRFGVGAVHKGPGGIAKWNFYGTGVRLWSPMGPDLGKVRVLLDGRELAVVDLHAGAVVTSSVVWEKTGLRFGPHALVLRSVNGVMPLDGVEVVAATPAAKR